MNTYVAPEGPHCGSGNNSMAALSQVSGGNHTYAGSSHDQLNDREASYSYGYNYTPTGTPTHSYSTADRTSEHHSLGRDSTARGSMRKGGKLVSMKVQMLDDSVITLDVPNGCLGMDLFKECCRHLNLLEMDYFGLEYFNKTDKVVWLDLEKPIARQVLAPKKTLFHFTVKFYLADPGQLHDEFTKYLYALQIKKDLSNGRLPCSENTAALMASYMLQAEVGDFSSPEHDDGRYITAFRFVPNQTRAMESKIQEYHKNHIGQTPADADFNLLDVARRLEMYGVRLHAARDYENVQLQLAVSHQGVLVFHNNTRINTFSWAKIRKLSFKRKRFLVKLHPEGFVSGYPRSTVEFMMSARNECKRFWKTCVEHHTFFRLTQSRHGRRPRRRLMSRGSTFRYSGRTQKQVVEDVRVTYIQRPGFGPSVSRVSTRSLGAPRTTTPLTIQLSENIVPDHHSAPDLSYGDEYPNGQGENAANSPTSISPTTPSSTPVTPVHDNSRIAIHKGNSNSSITYEYTVNEDSVQVLSSPEQNGETVHLENESTTEPESEEAAVSEDLKPKPEPMQELEVKLPVVNGDHNNTEGLSTNYSTDASDISIPSGSLHIDIDYEMMRRQVILDLPDEIEREDEVFERSPPTSTDRARSESESSGSSSGSLSIEDGEGLEYEDEIPTDEGFDLEILEKLRGPMFSEFEDDMVGKKFELPGMGMKFEIGENRAKLEILESLQRPVASEPDDASPTKSVEAEMGSAGSETSGELLGSMQAAASNGSTSSDGINYVETEQTDSDIRLNTTIDQVMKIAAELASPTDEPTTPSFETRSLDSLMNEEGSEMGHKGYDETPEDDPECPKDYSSFMKERQLVFADSSDTESGDSSLGVTLGKTNQNLTSLEVNLDETSAELLLLEQSLAETQQSLCAMESGALSDFSTGSPVFSPEGYDERNAIQLTFEESPLQEAPVSQNTKLDRGTGCDPISDDIINANTFISPFSEADLVRALTPTALDSHRIKNLRDSPPPPTPPPTPKVSVIDPPTHLSQISTVELHQITSFDDMLPQSTSPPSSDPCSPRKVKNIAHMLPDLPPPPPLPSSPLPESPPSTPTSSFSPLTSPISPLLKQDISHILYQRPPPVLPTSRPVPPPCAPKPDRKFVPVEMPPPSLPTRLDSTVRDEVDIPRSTVTRVQSSRANVQLNVKKTQYLVSKKEIGDQRSGFTEFQRTEFTQVRRVQASQVSSVCHTDPDETHKITLEFMTDNSEVSSIERPPPPVVGANSFKMHGQISPTSDRVTITPESSEMKLTRPGTFVTELKMIVRPGNISVSDSTSRNNAHKQEAAASRRDHAISRSSPESVSKRESMESTDSADSARQEFLDRSLEDLLNSPDIVGYPTPDDDTESLGERFLLAGDLHDSETSSTSSGSTDDSCVYHYEVADAHMTKIKGDAPLAVVDDDAGSSSDSSSSSSAEENGLLNRHAIGNGGILYTNTLEDSSRIFSDLQDMASPLSALSAETGVSSEDFD
ncbi:uncharacterized protein LOC117298336 isoform X1 [Asterias rubens]|uniref:uncharacterized protein LOC117298336 isoform X1 n=1 Tax=Asterias rubens TaxID=7604 RepID=UPI0014559A6E|nr:uncharacterized protein LOC117298336 isoform X1 [Asterias rubens]XP_033637420.1 uncharacterized protein LOC117298336 isoform X1 [Asterias rubens]XP_033637421.1 uncharacterized protein LOC117298336 isoform X1 [Asterias rubens]